MTSDATIFSRQIQGQGARHETFTKSNCMWRFRHFIEHSDWENVMFTHELWIDRLCIGVMIVAALYFIPIALVILFLG